MRSSHLLHFYVTVIRPTLEYASPLWHPTLTKSQAERVEAVQRRAINIIFGYPLLISYICYNVGTGSHSFSLSKTLGSFPAFFSENLSTH